MLLIRDWTNILDQTTYKTIDIEFKVLNILKTKSNVKYKYKLSGNTL